MKQYNPLIGDTGGKEDDLSKTINKALDEAYNLGVQHCIEATEIERDQYWSKNSRNIALLRAKALHNNVISKLEALKKKP